MRQGCCCRLASWGSLGTSRGMYICISKGEGKGKERKKKTTDSLNPLPRRALPNKTMTWQLLYTALHCAALCSIEPRLQMPRRRSSAKRARGALNTTKRDLSRPKHAEPSPVACKVEPDRDHTEAEEQLGVDADDGNFLEEGASLSQCLPWEVWVNVLAFLAQSDLIRYSLTCRLFHDIANMYV